MSGMAELRHNCRPLLAATFGLGTGTSAYTLYTMSIIAPRMIAELGWTKAQFAGMGALSLVIAFFFPLAGRMTDLCGVRRTVLVGIVVLPFSFFGYAMMTGPIWQYAAIYLACGVLSITTSTLVYSKAAVQHIDKARGLALAIVASGPALTGAIAAPFINRLVETEGWRTTSIVLGLSAVVFGIITMLLLPPDPPVSSSGTMRRAGIFDVYPLVLRTPAFWVLVAAMLACNLPQIIAMSQLKLLLMENGIAVGDTSIMLSALPVGVLAGRFVTGFALDRFPAHIVGFIALTIPSLGLALIASQFDAPAVLTFASFCLGFSVGAESDIVAFVVARKFGVKIYSTVMGLMTMAIALSVALGSVLLSLTLEITGRYDAFVILCACTVFVGGVLFLFVAGPRNEVPLRQAG